MRRSLAIAAFLALPALTMAQQNASPGQPPTTPPTAPRMTSDEVRERLDKGDIFFLDVREPRELAELGTFEG